MTERLVWQCGAHTAKLESASRRRFLITKTCCFLWHVVSDFLIVSFSVSQHLLERASKTKSVKRSNMSGPRLARKVFAALVLTPPLSAFAPLQAADDALKAWRGMVEAQCLALETLTNVVREPSAPRVPDSSQSHSACSNASKCVRRSNMRVQPRRKGA